MTRVKCFINYINNLSKPAKAAIVFMIASFFQQGLHVITTPIFTRILSTADYGIVSLYNSWFSMISVIATLSLSAGVFNIGMLEFEHDRPGFISSILILSNLATIFIAVILLLFKSKVTVIFQLPNSLLLLMFLTLILSPAMNFWIARQRYEFKYKSTAIVTILSSVLSTIVSINAVLNVNSNFAEVRLWSAGLVTSIITLPFYIGILLKGKKLIVWNYWKFALSFNLPLIPHYLAFSVLSGADRVMIANLVGTDAAGIYGLVYTVSSVGNIVWNSVNGSLIPLMHENMRAKTYQNISKVAKSSLIIYALFCLIVVLFAPEIVKILAPSEYYKGIFIFPPVMAGIFFMSIYNVFANIEFYYKKTFSIMIISLISAIMNIVLNYIFIPKYGYIAAAYTTLVCYVILAAMHYVNLRRIQEAKIYDICFFIKISLIVICFSLIANILYTYIILRYFIIIGFVLFFILFNKKILNVVKSIKS